MLVMAFSGWSDAAQSASEAADHIVSQYNGKVVASIDPNEYYDFQSSRPLVSLDSDGERVISWPTTEIVPPPRTHWMAVSTVAVRPTASMLESAPMPPV